LIRIVLVLCVIDLFPTLLYYTIEWKTRQLLFGATCIFTR